MFGTPSCFDRSRCTLATIGLLGCFCIYFYPNIWSNFKFDSAVSNFAGLYVFLCAFPLVKMLTLFVGIFVCSRIVVCVLHICVCRFVLVLHITSLSLHTHVRFLPTACKNPLFTTNFTRGFPATLCGGAGPGSWRLLIQYPTLPRHSLPSIWAAVTCFCRLSVSRALFNALYSAGYAAFDAFTT